MCGGFIVYASVSILYYISLYCLIFLTTIKSINQVDLSSERQKILSGEVALHSSALKRLSEEAARNPQKDPNEVNFSPPCVHIMYMFVFVNSD